MGYFLRSWTRGELKEIREGDEVSSSGRRRDIRKKIKIEEKGYEELVLSKPNNSYF